jgi:thioredoxin 1
MSDVIDITDSNFEAEVIKSDLPFLIDLSAEWCGPCKAIAPIVHELAAEYDGKVRFGQVDIDKNPEITVRYQVRSVPTLIMFQKGDVVGQLIGAHPRARIVELVRKGL